MNGYCFVNVFSAGRYAGRGSCFCKLEQELNQKGRWTMSKNKKELTEKPSDKVDKTGEDDFEKTVGELQRDMPKVAVEFHEKIMELEAVSDRKGNAKIRYQRELDSGNEEAMALCLKEIREQNAVGEKLRVELGEFPAVVKKLYERKERISGLARADQEAAAAKVREAEKLLKEAAGRVRRCYALMGQVNELNTSVQEIIRGFEKEKKTSEAEIKTPRSKKDGFWLEKDDPFAQGELRHYQKLKGVDDLVLPVLLKYADKEKAPVDEKGLKKRFEKSEKLKSEFGDLKTYIEFESLIIVQILKSYILRANGGGDRRRGFAGQAALQKCR